MVDFFHSHVAGFSGFALGIVGAIVTYGPQLASILPPKAQAVVGAAVSIAGLIIALCGKGPLAPKGT